MHVPDVHEAEPRRIEALVPLEGARVLDIGCGEGRLTGFAAARAASVYAFDPNAERVEKARAAADAELSASEFTAPRRSTLSARASTSRSAAGRSDASSRRAWSTP